MSSINLVVNRNDQLEKELKRLRIFRIIAIGSLIVVALISIIIFIINITLPIPAVRKDQQQTLSNISFLREKLVKSYLINNRIKNISDIMAKRKDYSKTFDQLLSKIPADLAIDAFEIEEGVITISISGNSLIPINDLINEVIKMGNEEKIIKNVAIEGLVLNAGIGRYILTLEADVL